MIHTEGDLVFTNLGVILIFLSIMTIGPRDLGKPATATEILSNSF